MKIETRRCGDCGHSHRYPEDWGGEPEYCRWCEIGSDCPGAANTPHAQPYSAGEAESRREV